MRSIWMWKIIVMHIGIPWSALTQLSMMVNMQSCITDEIGSLQKCKVGWYMLTLMVCYMVQLYAIRFIDAYMASLYCHWCVGMVVEFLSCLQCRFGGPSRYSLALTEYRAVSCSIMQYHAESCSIMQWWDVCTWLCVCFRVCAGLSICPSVSPSVRQSVSPCTVQGAPSCACQHVSMCVCVLTCTFACL
jgi:hypothetical protein